jgi:hypothetical protein
MGQQKIRGRRTSAVLGGTLAVASVIAVSVAGTAQAATPTVQLSFSQTPISGGTAPQMTFLSQNIPPDALLYLQESTDGGQQWKTIDKTTDTQATAKIAALPEGNYEFKILVAADNTVLASSAPALLTVTGADGALPTPVATPTQAPTTPATAPSSSGVPWLNTVVKDIWKITEDVILAWILSLF